MIVSEENPLSFSIPVVLNSLRVNSVLDVGCGDGSFEYLQFNDLQIIAFDRRFPQAAKSFPNNVRFIKAEGPHFPLKNGEFDLVIMSWILEHVGDPLLFIKEAERVLRRGGYLYVSIPNSRSLMDRLFRLSTTIAGSKTGPHIQKFTFQKFLELIYSATNFELISFAKSDAGFSFMSHPCLKVFWKPWMSLMFFLKKIGIDFLDNSNWSFLFQLNKEVMRVQ